MDEGMRVEWVARWLLSSDGKWLKIVQTLGYANLPNLVQKLFLQHNKCDLKVFD